MTVNELVALLATMPQTAEVIMLDGDAYPSALHSVEHGKACSDDDGELKVLLCTKWS